MNFCLDKLPEGVPAKYGFVGEEGRRAVLPDGAVVWTFPEFHGMILEAAESGETDEFVWPWRHVRVIEISMMDQTDRHNDLLAERERLLWAREAAYTLTCPAVAVEDALTGEGRVFLRLAPLPHARRKVEREEKIACSGIEGEVASPEGCNLPLYATCDFEINASEGKVKVFRTGYALATAEYRGGRIGRIRALHAIQRRIRRYEPGRDGLFLSNTWGDRSRDARINEAFLRKEIDAGAALGVDAVQIDDGWQTGRTANAAAVAAGQGTGAWNGYWAFHPQFWEPDPVRFPNGLEPVVSAAREKGLQFGLWFGPDSSHEAENWERDADRLLELHREAGIHYIKIDSLKTHSALALRRQRMLFDKVLRESEGRIVIDLDVTAEIRPGYFGLPDVGTIFVENRYTDWHNHWPHLTLRSLWTLAQAVDPVRLRMEVLNPLRNREQYEGDPLAPAAYRADTLFAMVMAGSPLGWFETSNLAPETVAAIRPLVDVWKQERTRFHGGDIVPVGGAPDGLAWTGFVSIDADGQGGSALLFRELNPASGYGLCLGGLLESATKASVLAGRGSATLDSGMLCVNVPETLDYVWVRLEV